MNFWWKLSVLFALVSAYSCGVWWVKGLTDLKAENKALSDLTISLNKSCEVDKQITKEANDDLAKQRDAIAARLATLQLQPAVCITPTANKTGADNSGAKHARQHGISSQWLRTYAAKCETYRQERLILEKFIDDTWAAKK